MSGKRGEASDQQLLNMTGQHAEAFEILYARYKKHLCVYVYAMLHDQDLTQEIVIETFLRLLEHRPRQRDLWPWLAAVAGNLARDELRRRSLVCSSPLQNISDEDELTPQELLCRHEEEIRKAVRSLSPMERTCLLLRYRDGLTVQNISRQLARSPRQVAIILQDACQVLRRRLVALSPAAEHMEGRNDLRQS